MIPWLTVILTTILNPQLYFCCWDCKYLLHTYYHITILIAILFQISSRGSRGYTHLYSTTGTMDNLYSKSLGSERNFVSRHFDKTFPQPGIHLEDVCLCRKTSTVSNKMQCTTYCHQKKSKLI